jgi:hypothetical protein
MLSLEFKNWFENRSSGWEKAYDQPHELKFQDQTPLKVTIWVNKNDRQIDAKVGNKLVGRMLVTKNQDVFKVVVDDPFKRLGIGTLMYRAAEENFGQLKPSGVVSDEGFAFWNKYRPGVFPKENLRHYASQLIGKLINHSKYGPCKIKSVGDNIAICEILQGEKQGMTTPVDRETIISQLKDEITGF